MHTETPHGRTRVAEHDEKILRCRSPAGCWERAAAFVGAQADALRVGAVFGAERPTLTSHATLRLQRERSSASSRTLRRALRMLFGGDGARRSF